MHIDGSACVPECMRLHTVFVERQWKVLNLSQVLLPLRSNMRMLQWNILFWKISDFHILSGARVCDLVVEVPELSWSRWIHLTSQLQVLVKILDSLTTSHGSWGTSFFLTWLLSSLMPCSAQFMAKTVFDLAEGDKLVLSLWLSLFIIWQY